MHIRYSEFYITNVCNLNCTNCNRANNFAFTGHQEWKDYADLYEKWSQVLEIDYIGILGGEPMLNPTFIEWLSGINKLWTKSKIKIITNGTQLHRHSELYNLIADNNQKIELDISFHGFEQKEKVMKDLMLWLKAPITTTVVHTVESSKLWTHVWDQIKDPSWPKCSTPQEFVNLPNNIQEECVTKHHVSLDIWESEACATVFSDKNGVTCKVDLSNHFNNSTVVFDETTKKLTLNNSNPDKALEVCYSKHCHHFIKGKLYKCGPAGILPDFLQQFPVELSVADRQLIDSYTPADINWSTQQLSTFVDDLINEKVIPQCKFCPENLHPTKFEAGSKKIKLVKIPINKPLLVSILP